MLGNAQCLVNRPCLPRPKDAPAVGDEGLGRLVRLDGGVEYGEVGREVLGRVTALERMALEWLSKTEIT